MLKTKDETFVKEGVGVIIARFQVHDLHEGHKELIDSVIERHDQVIVVVGLAEIKASYNNPLDFDTRRKMIEVDYPDVKVLYNDDCQSDQIWSKNLDKMIRKNISPGSRVVAYGSRDSFISHYHGFMATQEFVPQTTQSGTATRKSIMNKTLKSPEFRSGVIWATGNRYPTAYMAVDSAIFDDTYEHILLAKKPNEDLWRFVGGFVDPSDNYGVTGALEANVRRETYEEANIDITDPEYVSSQFVNDWRYRNEQDKIMSILFASKRLSGRVEAKDDIEYTKWFPISAVYEACVNQHLRNEVIDVHQPLLDSLIAWLLKTEKQK
jgi:bifunctional NMN adenylyltransferase/nudix hydrolase